MVGGIKSDKCAKELRSRVIARTSATGRQCQFAGQPPGSQKRTVTDGILALAPRPGIRASKFTLNRGCYLLTIRSSTSNRALQIFSARPDYLQVDLSGFPVSATSSIWVETGDVASLVDFFEALGVQQQPWQGQRNWASLEGDLRFAGTCSSLGAVAFTIELRGLQGAPEEWQVVVGIATELGQLVRIAEEATALQR